MAGLIFSALRIGISVASFSSKQKEAKTRQDAINAINRYWAHYADPLVLASKVSFRDLKAHIKQTASHYNITMEICNKAFDKKTFKAIAEPVREHFRTKINDLYHERSMKYAAHVLSQLNELLVNNRTISMLQSISPIQHFNLLGDFTEECKQSLALINEFTIDPISGDTTWSDMLTSYVAARYEDFEITICSDMIRILKTASTMFTQSDPGFLRHIFNSAKTIVRKEQDGDSFDYNDRFCKRNITNHPDNVIPEFKKLWQSYDPQTYYQFTNNTFAMPI